jgi:hypothetical protein
MAIIGEKLAKKTLHEMEYITLSNTAVSAQL